MLFVNNTLLKVNAYCQAFKPYVSDTKVAAVALSALGYVATAFSFFLLPLPVCAALACCTLAGTYKTFTLFEKAYKEAQAELAKAEAEKKAREEEAAKKTAAIVTAVPQDSFLRRLFGTATNENKVAPAAV